MATDRREVRHPDALRAAFVDQAHAREAIVVAWKPRADLVEEAPVDLEDDLEVPRQETREERHRPGFECLGQQRVVGGERSPERPRPWPSRPGRHEEPHQLRRQRRMRWFRMAFGWQRRSWSSAASGGCSPGARR
jgi:hypothetical protein